MSFDPMIDGLWNDVVGRYFALLVVGVWNLEVGPSKSLVVSRRKMRQTSKDIFSAVIPFIAIFSEKKEGVA